ncbi:MAG: universal stress protein [Bacillota bacterium]|nr:universal stress protein [Bacillota bacterium]MDW7684208.1 universal stress protein [Bacillota bacterium]
MKILVCVDGSEQSVKALHEAANLARGYNTDEITVIHVFVSRRAAYFGEVGFPTSEILAYYRDLEEQEKENSKKILLQAMEILEGMHLKAKTIFRQGHPAATIAQVVEEDGFDLVVMGSRGLGGLKKVLLGSVSNAVLQEVSASVYIVK